MSFFYGLRNLNDSSYDSPKSNNATAVGSSHGNSTNLFTVTTLPGHNFKDVFATGAIVIDILSIISAIVLVFLVTKTGQIRAPQELKKDKDALGAWKKLWRPAYLVRASCVWLVFHLLFDVAIRICIELRLKMPFVFSVVEIPSKLFLMVVDVLLVLNITRPIVCMTMRLNNCDGLWNLLFRPLLLLGYVNLGILYFAERIGGIYKMYTLSFNWDKADPQYYANILLSYGSTLVWFGIFLFLGALISFNKSRPAQRNAENCKDRIPCGKMPLLLLFVITPCYLVRALCRFGFIFYFNWGKRPQDPKLELLKVVMNYFPAIAILGTLYIIQRSDQELKKCWDCQLLYPAQPYDPADIILNGPVKNGSYIAIVEHEIPNDTQHPYYPQNRYSVQQFKVNDGQTEYQHFNYTPHQSRL